MEDVRKTALESDASVRLIMGEPGSGKTYFGCEAARYELMERTHSLLPHQGVLFLTFARNAVARIRDVLLSGSTEQAYDAFKNRVRVETFCGFFWWLVESYGRYCKDVSADRLWLVHKSRPSGLHVPSGHTGCTFEEIHDLGVQALRIPAVSHLLSELWPVVIVDEFQDVDDLLFEAVCQLAAKSRTLLLFGPGQSVYRWRGADPEKVLRECTATLSPKVYKIEPLAGRGSSRFDPPLRLVVDAYDKGAVISDSSGFPIRFYSPEKAPDKPLENQAVYATMDALDYLRKANVGPTVAVLCYTNSMACLVHRRLTQPSDASRRKPIRARLCLDDQLLTYYGRLVLYLLRGHWISQNPESGMPSEASAEMEALASAAREGKLGIPGEQCQLLSANMFSSMADRRPPKTGVTPAAKLRQDVEEASKWLYDKAHLAKSGLKTAQQRTPFDKDERAVVLALADELVRLLETAIHGCHLDLPEAQRKFERYVQQKIAREKAGFVASVEVMTIHKSKGREFDGVVLLLEDEPGAPWKQSSKKDEAELKDVYYVAVSRARSALAIVARVTAGGEARPCVAALLPVNRFPR